MIPLLAALALQGGWQTYALGGFGFLLPAKPMPYSAPGAPKEARYWNLLHNGRNGVAVTIVPASGLEKATPDVLLAGGLTGLLDKGSTLKSQRDILVGGWPGLDVRWKDADGTFGAGRLVMAGGTMVMVLLSGDTAEGIEPPFARIAGSIKPPRAGTQRAAGPSFVRHALGKTPASVEFPAEPKPFPAPTPPGWEGTDHSELSAQYGNRLYRSVSRDIPEAFLSEADDEASAAQAIRLSAERAIAAFGSKSPKYEEVKVDGSVGLRATGVFDGGRGAFRVETTLRDGRVYGFMAVVPSVLRNSPEVERFFASIRLSAPAG